MYGYIGLGRQGAERIDQDCWFRSPTSGAVKSVKHLVRREKVRSRCYTKTLFQNGPVLSRTS